MEPTWVQISDWLAGSPDHLACIREIASERKLFHLQGSDGQQHLVFRHDRVRASVLARSLRRRLDANELADDLISEPYYAEFLGLALASVREGDETIKKLKEHNPLALVHAVVAAEASEVALVDALVSAVLDWLKQPGAQSRGNESLCFHMQLALASVDSPAVMQIADGFTLRTWALDIAKLRNGDAVGGASLCYSSGPSGNDPRRDQLIEHVLGHHRSGMLAGVTRLLTSDGTSSRLLSGALSLAGFLGQAELADAILSAWQRHGETDVIPEFLWAASLCCGSRPQEIIGPILDALQQVPDTKDSHGQNQRTALVYNAGLRFGFARRLKGPPVRYLADRAQNSELTGAIVWALEKVDDEGAATFIAEQMGAVSRRLEGTGSWSPWLGTDDWYDRSAKRRYSLRSRDRLRTLWTDISQDRHSRRYAFQLWCSDVAEDDLPTLRGIARDDTLDDRAVRARLELGDQTVVERFREKISSAKHPSFWWQFVQRSWRDDYLPDLRGELERRRQTHSPSWANGFDTDHNIASLIATLPSNLATELLSLHWDHLHFSSDFVQTALYVATDTCARLVSETVADAPDPKQLFTFLSMHWQTGGRAEINRLTARRLAGLEPYLDFLDEHTVHGLWEGCNTDGFVDWRRRFLDSRLSELWRKRSGLLESDLRADLDRIASGPGRPWPYHWLEEFERRGETATRALAVASAWFANIHSLRAFEVLAECVAHSGRRQDLSLLDVTSVPEADAAAAQLVYRNARFSVFKRTLL